MSKTQAQEQLTPPRTLEDVAIECKTVYLHAALAFPGWFTASTLCSGEKMPGLKLYWIPGGKIDGLVLKYKGKSRILPKAAVAMIEPVADL